MSKTGEKIFNLIKKLYPINRSLTGIGNLETLKIIKNIIPKLKILKFKSGKKVFDWKIPDEWSVKSAYIADPNGKKITNKDLSNFILENNHFGVNELVFVVGGAFGIHKKILSKYTTFSFGELIWSHSLFRVMLTEQIYRSFCKINGHPYEK